MGDGACGVNEYGGSKMIIDTNKKDEFDRTKMEWVKEYIKDSQEVISNPDTSEESKYFHKGIISALRLASVIYEGGYWQGNKYHSS